jgi:hypothetical protein
VPGKTGLFFTEPTAASLASVLEKFNPDNFSNQQIQNSAARFSPSEFRKKFTSLLKSVG